MSLPLPESKAFLTPHPYYCKGPVINCTSAAPILHPHPVSLSGYGSLKTPPSSRLEDPVQILSSWHRMPHDNFRITSLSCDFTFYVGLSPCLGSRGLLMLLPSPAACMPRPLTPLPIHTTASITDTAGTETCDLSCRMNESQALCNPASLSVVVTYHCSCT